MRILYLCHLTPSTCDYPLFLAQAWERLGHTVELFPVDIEYVQSQRARLRTTLLGWNRSLLYAQQDRRVESVCKRFQPDILLCGGTFLTPGGVFRIQRRDGCKVGFLLSYNHLLEEHTTALTRSVDFIIAHDSYMIPILKGHGYGKTPHVFFMPCMADPTEHQPLADNPNPEGGGDILFIGGWSETRATDLECFIDHDLRIWGYGWDRSPTLKPFYRAEPVYGLKKTRLYGSAKMVLNLQEPEKQINSISNRIPEVLACGGFILTDWHKDLDRTPLKDGESVVCYRSQEEMVEKARYYLAHDEERKAISRRGREVVLESMTYDHVGAKLAGEMASVLEGQPAS